MTLRIGQQLGNYQLTRLLGEGGFAQVYQGEHLHLGTQAAIKVLQTQLTSDDVETFRAEARTIAHLLHPNIVRVLEFGIEGKTPYLVMDYAPGGTLRQRHPKGTSVPLANVVSYVKQMADALQYAHDNKLIHRDVKPENMLLGRRNEVLLSDFGIALVAQSSRYQSTQDLAGTIAYMAPEQIQGKPREASDQYALAVVVYEWLSGDRPFHGSFSEIAVQHAVAPPPPLRGRVLIAPSVEQIVMRGLAKEPKERFSSVQTFSIALEQAFQEEQAITISLHSPSAHVSSPSHVPLTVATSMATTQPGTSPASVGEHLFSYRNHTALVTTIAWSPDSVHIVSGSSDKTVQIWEARTGRTKTVWNFHSSPVRAVAWTKSGAYIASADEDATVSIWEPMTGRVVMTYQEHKKYVSALAWAPDSDHIASGSFDKTIHLWSAVTGRKVLTYQGHTRSMGAWIKAVAWSPNGSYIASGDYNGEIYVWDALTGISHWHSSVPGKVNALAWSPDSDRIAIACSNGRLLVQSLAQENTSRYHMDQNKSIDLTSIVWSPDGKFIALGDERHQVHIWDPVSEQFLYLYQGHTNRVLAVAWSPNGQWIASASADKTVQVWQAP